MLSESFNIIETNRETKGTQLIFMPISKNVGIAFYYDPTPIVGYGSSMEYKSDIFKSDISSNTHRIKLVKKGQVHRDDRFIHKVIQEEKEVADLLNGMALVHNKDCILIYQDKRDIESAEKMIEIRKICRLEDIR